MSAAEVIEPIKQLRLPQQREVFVRRTQPVCSQQETCAGPWLGKPMTFEEACDVAFRENRELLGLLAQ
ncbi:MAG: hypothetical protein MUE94_00210 [Verrucomicrobia bacterium]|jgi:hypothetical protein|nr:hypothetical protein [Verrucomicrobiota bacterium]